MKVLLLARQSVQYSKQINQYTAQTLPKITALQSLQDADGNKK